MTDQRFHLRIYIFFLRQIIFRNIGMKYFCFGSFKFLHFLISLL